MTKRPVQELGCEETPHVAMSDVGSMKRHELKKPARRHTSLSATQAAENKHDDVDRDQFGDNAPAPEHTGSAKR